MKKIIIFSVLPFFLILLIIIACCSGDSDNSTEDYTFVNLPENVLAYKPTVEKYCREFGIEDYVSYILAIIMVESGGNGNDIMQCSESLGLPPNSINTPEHSIKQGCKVFSEHLAKINDLGCDIDTALQAYNYGGAFIDYVAERGKKYTFDLAESFAEKMSGGEKTSYINEISKVNGGWVYTYGNMFYVPMVKQYITYGADNLGAFALQFEGEGHNRFTSYQSKNSQAFGADWCAMFVCYCADQMGYIDSGKVFWFNGCTTAFNRMLAEGTFKYSSFYKGTYTPKAGDFIFFTNDYGKSSNHVGIVTGCANGIVETIEGNSGVSSSNPYWHDSKVTCNSYSLGNSSILGYFPMS